MRFTDRIGKELLLFDGAMGTMLLAKGLPDGITPDLATMACPEMVRDVHAAYLDAGADILKTNTFGTNRLKLTGSGYTVREVVRRAVSLAREAGHGHAVALSLGPSGKLLAPLGDMDFEDAYTLFAETAQAGAEAGADAILVETMSDAYELKAAVLAARDTGLPVLATVTADASGKLLTGADMETVAALLEGLRVHALGVNCGLGPEALLPCLARLRSATGLPLILNPNAGLPREVHGQTVFDQDPQAFAGAMARAVSLGASLLGGCCGTTPGHIRAMAQAVKGLSLAPAPLADHTVVCSGSRAVRIDPGAPVLIGERINPTGKPAMKAALRDGKMDVMLREAVRQQDAGAEILDVNAGLPGIDEAAWLSRLVPAIQAVSDLPLQIDTADPAALSGALRRYNGKPMVNSVNGKKESMDAVFPLLKRYGGVVVALTLDENGIPATAMGRVAIARRILDEAARYGIAKRDIVFDPLTLAVSAEPGAARITLEALSLLRAELGVETMLGVSNISFGLPRRGALNAAFFTLAAGAGLSAAIVNPFSGDIMAASRAVRALRGDDPGCAAYIAAMADAPAEPAPRPASPSLRHAIERGLAQEAASLAALLAREQPPLAIVEHELIPALNAVGAAFEAGAAFLPQLLMSAEAAKAAFAALDALLAPGERGGRGKVVIATVQGDIHDIGKNIAKSMLENYRFDVIDLGRDVPPQCVVDAALAHRARLVGLSALMTTTVTSMEATIRALRRRLPDVRIMVGGAVLTEAYAAQIGADRYVKDAMDGVRYAEEVLGG